MKKGKSMSRKQEKTSTAWGKEWKGLWGIFMPFLIYYLCYMAAAFALTIIVMALLQSVFGAEEAFLTKQEASINGLINGLAMLIGVIPLLPGLQQTLSEAKKEIGCTRKPLVKIPITILLAVSTALSVNILFILCQLTESSDTYQQVAEKQYGVAFGLGLVLYGIVSPLAEEVVFRGIIFNRLKKEYSVVAAVCISALLFGIYHGNSVQGIYAFLIGCFIAYVYERFGSFFYAVLFHGAANVAVYVTTGTEALYQIAVNRISLIFLTLVAMGLLVYMENTKESKREKNR